MMSGKSGGLGLPEIWTHRYRDERLLIRFAHPGLKSWAGLKPIKKSEFIKMSPERAVLKKDQAEEERELLRLFLEKEGLSSQNWEITPAETGKGLPLSWSQRRLWFLDRLKPGSDFYNIALACDLHGDLNVPALE